MRQAGMAALRNGEHRRRVPLLGWREWLSLPDLGVPWIKAKVDTGARTSALHAFSLVTFRERGVLMVRFRLHPLQSRSDIVSECVAPVSDRRWVSDSGGHREKRLVIESRVLLGRHEWPVEMTLTGRDTMRFRMLLGRHAIRSRFVVDPGSSYLQGRQPDGRGIGHAYRDSFPK